MNLETFAKQILFSDCLEDKLFIPDSFEDNDKGLWLASQNNSICAPEQPGRPSQLKLGNKGKGGFPKETLLHVGSERGKVLHFFANHELMALELMALALLKFVDAPTGFRMDIARTMLDEQRHMRLYMERMHDLGVEFGAVPVGDYFWRNFRGMQTPMDYICGLSLTLEQANLDFAHHYLSLFQNIDDPQSRDVMFQVYEDEIQHVKQGVKWFDRWRDPELSQWEAYNNGLHFPMTPSRGKGLGFNREGRLRAGFDPSFIDEMEILTEHRGRPRRVWVYNPSCEFEVAEGKKHMTAPKLRREAAEDLANLPMFLSNRADILYTNRAPSKSFLKEWKQRGLIIPEIVVSNDGLLDGKEFEGRIVGGLSPWGWSPAMMRLLKRVVPDSEATGQWPLLKPEQFSEIYAKHNVLQLRRHLRETLSMVHLGPELVDGGMVSSFDEIEVWRRRIANELQLNTVLKAPFGTAGLGQVRIEPDRALRDSERGWIRKVLENHRYLLVEPWVLDVDDFSALMNISEEGKAGLIINSRFFTDARGQYLGSIVGNMVAGMNPGLRRDIEYETNGLSIRKQITQAGQETAHWLAAQGFYGPAGLDTYTYRLPGHGDQRFFKPVGEINYRYTMGHVSQSFKQFLGNSVRAIWMPVGLRFIQDQGFAQFSSYADDLIKRFPAKFNGDGKLISGILFTNEPEAAKQMLGIIAAGREVLPSFTSTAGISL